MAKGKSKAKPAATTTVASTSKRASYKRKKNARINVLDAQLQTIDKGALKAAQFNPKATATS